MWLWSEQIDEMLTQKSGWNSKCSSVWLEIKAFLTHLLEGQLCQAKPFPSSQSNVLLNKRKRWYSTED